MRIPRHDRIRGIAAVVVLVASVLFTWSPISWLPDPTSSRAAGLAALLLLAAGAAGLRRALGPLLASAAPAASRAGALPWVLLYGLLAATGLVAALGSVSPTAAAWAALPMGGAAAALLGAVVSERIGLREGLISLPLLALFGLAAAAAGADPRYLQALLLCDVLVVPLMAALLPAPERGNLGWYVVAAGTGLSVAALLLFGSAPALVLTALATGALLRLHPPGP